MKDSGFILLEVLLALVILGAVFVVSIQALSGSVRALSSAESMNTTAALAQELLARVCTGEMKSGINEGRLDANRDVSWLINRTALTDSENSYDITIRWNEQGLEKDLKLSTRRRELKL